MHITRRQLLGVSLTSLSNLILEVVLTRVFSVTMRYHFAFLAISLALMGSAMAGVVLYFVPNWTRPPKARRWIGLAAIALAISVPASFVLYLVIPFQRVLDSAGFSPQKVLYLALICLDMTIPFFLSGLVLSLALAAWPEQAGRVYWADLTGAALGCLAAIVALEALGGVGAVLAVGVVACLAGVVLTWGIGKRQVLAIALAVVLCGLVWGSSQRGWITISAEKAGINTKKYTKVYEHWNAHSQVTVYDTSYYPFFWSVDLRYWDRTIEEGRFLNHALLLIDAVAGTPVQEFRGLLHEVEFLHYDLSSFVYHVVEQPKTLVIGSGGGRDVLAALASGAPHVTAVEINPAVVEVVRGPYAEFSGHLYERADVTIAVDDARGYITRSPERYDVIQASLIDTWAAGGSGAFALSENSLYTVEAFRTYYDHLTDRGMLTVSRWYLTERPAETMRLVSTGMAGWASAGVEDPRRHVAVVARPNAAGELEGMATALFTRSPLTPDQVAAISERAEELGFAVLYAPDVPVHEEVGQFIAAVDHASFASSYPLDISPATDDRPFFFNLVRFGNLLDLSVTNSRVYRTSVEALLILATVSGVTAGMGILFVLLPLSLGTRRRGLARPSWRLLAYFAILGIGFMLVELSIIQRLTVYLGRPVYSLAVVLFTLLVSSGLGSLWSGSRVAKELPRRLGLVFLLLAALVGLHAVGGDWLLRTTDHWPLCARMALTGVLLAPLGLFLGMPFPLGMHWVGSRRPGAVPWLWGINGVMSVLGSALSVALAIHVGLRATMLVAAGLYGLAGVVLGQDVRRTGESGRKPGPPHHT